MPNDWHIVEIGEIAREVSETNGRSGELPGLSCTKYDRPVDSLKYFDKLAFSHDTSRYEMVRRGQFADASNPVEERLHRLPGPGACRAGKPHLHGTPGGPCANRRRLPLRVSEDGEAAATRRGQYQRLRRPSRQSADIPAVLCGNDHAVACFGMLEPYFTGYIAERDRAKAKTSAVEAAVSIGSIVERNRVVGFWDNLDAQRRTMNDIDDYLHDVIKGENGVPLTTEEMDEIIDRTMQLARYRMPS